MLQLSKFKNKYKIMGEMNKDIYVIFGTSNNSINKVLVRLLKSHIVENHDIEEKNIFDVLDDNFTDDAKLNNFITQVNDLTKSKSIKYIYLNFYKTEQENIDFLKFFKEKYTNILSFKDYLG